MKADKVQKQSKDRSKGLRTADFIKRRSKRPSSRELLGTWPLMDLYCEPVDLSNNLENTPFALQNHWEILCWVVATLSMSPVARMLIKEAAQEDWEVGIAELQGYDFHLDVPEKQILLDDSGLLPCALGRSGYFLNVLLASFIRALRDVWQEKRYGGFDENYQPESILMLERVRAADCDVLSVLIGWELRSEGRGDFWRHLMGSEEGDMAMSFSAYLEHDPSSLFSGTALARAFDQWYRCHQRVNTCDHEALEYLDGVIRDNPGSNPFGDKKLTRTCVEILSCLPDKTAYLQGCGGNILTDPLYAGLHDPINQAHFMQLVYDMQVVHVEGVPFRDSELAAKIFPNGKSGAFEETYQENS